MTDLVCASSACPDDIDPANGWELTDVHVRVYSPENRFSMAIAHRVTPEAEPVLTQETTFHPRTSALTESFVEYRGYWLPHCYNNEGAIAEYWACREKAVVMDLSPLRKWEVLGPDAETLIQHAITRDARRLAVGHVVYTAVCNETGGMIDDATVFRLGDDNFRFIGGDPYDGIWLKDLADRLGLKAYVKPSTDQLHNLAVQGPESRAIMQQARLDPEDAALDRRAQVVPLRRRALRRLPGHPRRGLAHGLHRRARLRGLLPPRRRPRRLGRDLGGRPAARPEAAGPRGARHDPHRGGPDLRRLRVRRPGRPVRGGHRLRGQARQRGRLRRQGRADRALRASPAPARRARARGQRDRRARRRGLDRPPARGRRHQRHAQPDAAQERRAVPHGRSSTPRTAPSVEVGKLDGLQKRIAAKVVRFPFYDPDKTRPRS